MRLFRTAITNLTEGISREGLSSRHQPSHDPAVGALRRRRHLSRLLAAIHMPIAERRARWRNSGVRISMSDTELKGIGVLRDDIPEIVSDRTRARRSTSKKGAPALASPLGTEPAPDLLQEPISDLSRRAP